MIYLIFINPLALQFSQHYFIAYGNIIPISFHVLAYLACEENYCTNVLHKILVFINSYNISQQPS